MLEWLSANPSFVATLLGALVGAFASIAATALSLRSSAGNQKKARSFDYWLKVEERRRTDYVRLQELIQSHDRQLAIWAKEELAGRSCEDRQNEADEARRQALSELFAICARLADRELARRINLYIGTCTADALGEADMNVDQRRQCLERLLGTIGKEGRRISEELGSKIIESEAKLLSKC